MNYQQFIKRILEDDEYLDDYARQYLRKHARRFFSTYKFCLKNLKPGAKILSIGAFYAPIEKILKDTLMGEVTVVDFPDSVEMLKSYYDFLGFKYVGIDLSQGLSGLPENYFDMIIYTEVIEHIPTSPYNQIKPFDKYIVKGGKIVISTPNLASIVTIGKLLMGFPLFDAPDKFFSPVSKENLMVHRREYIAKELVEAFDQMGYQSDYSFFIYNEAKSLAYRFMYLICALIPKLRQGILIVGTK